MTTERTLTPERIAEARRMMEGAVFFPLTPDKDALPGVLPAQSLTTTIERMLHQLTRLRELSTTDPLFNRDLSPNMVEHLDVRIRRLTRCLAILRGEEDE